EKKRFPWQPRSSLHENKGRVGLVYFSGKSRHRLFIHYLDFLEFKRFEPEQFLLLNVIGILLQCLLS
ncbi:MAG: hypothetical protein AB2693_15870, partial [Candidatus Thiodiazotropha sp.]